MCTRSWYMLWRCPKLPDIGTRLLTQNHRFKLPRDPVSCLFGVLEEESFTPHAHTMVLRLIYTARKLIARYWFAPRVPTRGQCIEQVNNMLIRKKLTYQQSNIFEEHFYMWQPWLDVPGLAPHQLVRDRILQG